MSDAPERTDDRQPAPGGAAPAMDKIKDDPKRDPSEAPATRRTVEVECDGIERTGKHTG